MIDVVMAIAAPLAKTYGINKAIEIAYEQLGLETPQQTEIDLLTGGGINKAFAPANLLDMAKRGFVDLGIRSLAKNLNPAALGPIGFIGGLAFLGNKYRKQLTGFDTQAAYEAEQEARRADRRLDYITDRMTKGKDYANYRDALKDSRAGVVEIDGTMYQGPDYQGETKSKDKSNGKGGKGTGGLSSSERGAALHGAKGGLARYYRGGIASL